MARSRTPPRPPRTHTRSSARSAPRSRGARPRLPRRGTGRPCRAARVATCIRAPRKPLLPLESRCPRGRRSTRSDRSRSARHRTRSVCARRRRARSRDRAGARRAPTRVLGLGASEPAPPTIGRARRRANAVESRTENPRATPTETPSTETPSTETPAETRGNDPVETGLEASSRGPSFSDECRRSQALYRKAKPSSSGPRPALPPRDLLLAHHVHVPVTVTPRVRSPTSILVPPWRPSPRPSHALRGRTVR